MLFQRTDPQRSFKTSPIAGVEGFGCAGGLLARMNMAGYLKTPSGPHSHFPTHLSLGSGLGSGLTGMPMPGLGPFGLPHSLDPVPFPQGKFI